jgi:deoxyribodipyrimidine photolyase
MRAATVVWFRLDLRLADNPALAAAATRGARVMPVFIWAPEEEGDWPPGAASRWWLHQSLRSLDAALRRLGVPLILRRGPSLVALRLLIRESGADAAPYFRILDPATQAEKFDPLGDYVRHWVPEIDTPGYPRPIVNHAQARERALEALAANKQP